VPDHPKYPRLRRFFSIDSEFDEDVIRRCRAAYYGLITFVDELIGGILDALEETGLAQDTFILFTGDHGEMLGERGLWWKSVMLEGAARVPMVCSFPGHIPAGERRDSVVSLVDVFPTFMDVAGVPQPDFLAGASSPSSSTAPSTVTGPATPPGKTKPSSSSSPTLPSAPKPPSFAAPPQPQAIRQVSRRASTSSSTPSTSPPSSSTSSPTPTSSTTSPATPATAPSKKTSPNASLPNSPRSSSTIPSAKASASAATSPPAPKRKWWSSKPKLPAPPSPLPGREHRGLKAPGYTYKAC
jgi:hypothetical protein